MRFERLTRGFEWIGQDARHAARALRRTPLFSGVAVACLALGVAANTTMFSVFDALVLRPLPFVAPDRLVTIGERDRVTARRGSPVYAEYEQWTRTSRSFTAIGAHAGRGMTITDGGSPERIAGRLVSASMFPLLGVRAQLGRIFTPEDDGPGAARVAVIGDALWRRRYGADSSILGRTIHLDYVPYTVVGVMGRGFAFPGNDELWIAISPALAALAGGARGMARVSVVGRLRTGMSIEQASLEAATLYRASAALRTDRLAVRDSSWTADVRSMRGSALGSDERIVASAMLGATTFLLLIACANVANLFLTRGVARRREVAVRTALGASRSRIAAVFLTESLLIALAACIAALPLIWEALRLIRAAIPPSDAFPSYVRWSLDVPTFVWASGSALVTAVLFGIGPSMNAARAAPQDVLKEGAQGTGRAHGRVRNALVVGQIALALVLLVGASLFVRTFLGLRRMDLGYDPARVMTMRFFLPGERYDSTRRRWQFVDDALRRVQSLPGVTAATISDLIPLDDEGGSQGDVIGDGLATQRASSIVYAGVTSGWFDTFGIPIIAGRGFTAAETRDSTPVAVINASMAAVLWQGASPIGRQFRLTADAGRTWFTVIGVVPDVRTVKLDEDRRTPPTAYLPIRFVPTRDYGLMLRTPGAPTAIAGSARAALQRAGQGVPVFNVWSMDEVRYLSFWMYALWGTMFGAFGVLALSLATIGVYAVISYGVAQRTREIGVCVALGARRGDVIRLVLGGGIGLAAAGIALGLAGALALTPLVKDLLIGVTADDPASFASVALLLGVVAVAASYAPARRATAVDPLVALRHE